MPRRGFHFAGHALRVEGAEAPLAWLHEFVTPHFAARDTEAPDRTIAFTVDAREHARLVDRGPHPERRERPCFTLDSAIASGRVWGAPGAGEVVFDPELEVFYRLAPDRPARVDLVAARDDARARLALLRVVREYAMRYAARAGWLVLHAAAVSVAGRVFVIAGPKEAGKTTLLLHALSNEGGAYIANDRVALDPGPSGVTVRGIPTIVRIRRSSALWFADLDGRLERAGYHYGRGLTEPPAEHETPPARRISWGLSPAQLCRVLGVDARASGRVTAVLFPRVGAPGRGVTFERLSEAQALVAWRAALSCPAPPDGLFAIDPGVLRSPEAAVNRLAARLVTRVPSMVCHVGPGAYREGSRWMTDAGQGFRPAQARARAASRPS